MDRSGGGDLVGVGGRDGTRKTRPWRARTRICSGAQFLARVIACFRCCEEEEKKKKRERFAVAVRELFPVASANSHSHSGFAAAAASCSWPNVAARTGALPRLAVVAQWVGRRTRTGTGGGRGGGGVVWRHERKSVPFFMASSLNLAFTPCKDNIAVWTLLGRSALWNSCKHEHTAHKSQLGAGSHSDGARTVQATVQEM